MNSKKLFSITLTLLMLAGLLLTPPTMEASSDQIQEELFIVIGVTARSSSGSLKIYPGSRRASLRIEAIYIGDESAIHVYGHLRTAEGINFSAGSGPVAQARALNGSIDLKVEKGEYITFDYYLDVSKSLEPGVYVLSLNITYRLETASALRWEVHEVPFEVSEYPRLSLSVIDAYLSPASYPGSVNTNLYVLMENSGESNIVSARFNVALPEGFVINSPRASVGAVNVGERFTIMFSGVSVPLNAEVGAYSATIYVNAAMRTDDNVNYNSTGTVTVKFRVSDPPREDPIIISSVSILYQGSPAPLLPSANGVTVRVTLVNRLPEAVGGISIVIRPPNNVNVREVSGTYANGMAPGGSCFIDIAVDVSPRIRPGLIEISMDLSYVKIVSGASYVGRQSLSVKAIVETPHSYVPEVLLISAYWGSPDPMPVYSGSRYVPLTLRFINDGRYDVVGGVVEANSSLLRPIKSSETLGPRLIPGSSSSVTLYFDVNADAGEVPLDVSVSYVFEEFGVHLNVTREFSVYLPVEEYPASSSNLMVVYSGWQGNYNVFPRTDNATYQVTIANRAPFPVSGIILQLNLPGNMSSQGGKVAKTYIEGPVRSLSTFTASFTVSVGDVRPGKYWAKLTVDFTLLSGGPGMRCYEEFNLTISVNDDSDAIELVSARWYEGSVGPNTYGAHLLISVRNNYIDGMRGAILEVKFPEGFLNALDNSSLARVSPLSAGFVGFSQQIFPQDLGAQISEYLRTLQAGQAQAFSRGDILTFMLSVNVLNVSLGVHSFEGEVSYIDQWGTRRSAKVVISVVVLGRAHYINIYMSGSLNVRSRFTNTSLIIENVGTSPLYDVYTIISPYQGTPILIASPTIKYIGKIDAGGKAEIPITLVYNPIGFMSQAGGATIITYGPVPLMTSMIYRDASGALRSFNNTITVVVEPFIDLLVKDISASGKVSSSTVSGVVANYGSATAYRVRATFNIGNMSGFVLVGDVTPGEEMAFKVEVPRYGETGTLRIEYYDAFNEQFSKEFLISVEMLPEAPVTLPKEEGLGFERWIVIGAVIAFLVFAFLLIYRALRSRSLNKV
ncbi:MAG: hypothetical protein QW702_05515 [Candidatus Bathyarchaeia archaeon]